MVTETGAKRVRNGSEVFFVGGIVRISPGSADFLAEV